MEGLLVFGGKLYFELNILDAYFYHKNVQFNICIDFL